MGGALRPPQPPPLSKQCKACEAVLSRAKRASKPVEAHHIAFANRGGGGGWGRQPPRILFLSRAERASKPKKLVDTHHVSRVFASGGGPTPPASFKPYQACFKAQETS